MLTLFNEIIEEKMLRHLKVSSTVLTMHSIFDSIYRKSFNNAIISSIVRFVIGYKSDWHPYHWWIFNEVRNADWLLSSEPTLFLAFPINTFFCVEKVINQRKKTQQGRNLSIVVSLLCIFRGQTVDWSLHLTRERDYWWPNLFDWSIEGDF